jgi:hypothetical protein
MRKRRKLQVFTLPHAAAPPLINNIKENRRERGSMLAYLRLLVRAGMAFKTWQTHQQSLDNAAHPALQMVSL